MGEGCAFADSVRFDADTMWGHLSDGRILGAPLAWFPRLMAATPAQLAEVEISPFGLHWATLHEDLSVPALLSGEARTAAA